MVMDKHFHALKVAEIVPETAEANSIRFEIPPELREAFAFKAGQHLTLKATIGGEEVRRNYSLCTAPDEQDWMVTVKRIANGIFSNWVGDNLKSATRSKSCLRMAASRRISHPRPSATSSASREARESLQSCRCCGRR